MPAKKIRVEVFDESGNRYTISFEGRVTREKALRLLDIVELLGGVHDDQELEQELGSASKFDKTKSVIKKYFSFTWASSKDILAVYEQEFNEPISLSTVSTYLARMTDRGFLVRRGPAHNRKYRMIAKMAKNNLKIVEDK